MAGPLPPRDHAQTADRGDEHPQRRGQRDDLKLFLLNLGDHEIALHNADDVGDRAGRIAVPVRGVVADRKAGERGVEHQQRDVQLPPDEGVGQERPDIVLWAQLEDRAADRRSEARVEERGIVGRTERAVEENGISRREGVGEIGRRCQDVDALVHPQEIAVEVEDIREDGPLGKSDLALDRRIQDGKHDAIELGRDMGVHEGRADEDLIAFLRLHGRQEEGWQQKERRQDPIAHSSSPT